MDQSSDGGRGAGDQTGARLGRKKIKAREQVISDAAADKQGAREREREREMGGEGAASQSVSRGFESGGKKCAASCSHSYLARDWDQWTVDSAFTARDVCPSKSITRVAVVCERGACELRPPPSLAHSPSLAFPSCLCV